MTRESSTTLSRITELSRHSGVRFVVVGGLSLGANTGALYVLHGLLKLPLPLGAALSFAVAFVVNFGLNRIWTFGSDGSVLTHLWRYITLVCVNLGLNAVLVPALTWQGVPYLISQAMTTVSIAAMNYFVSRRWIFT